MINLALCFLFLIILIVIIVLCIGIIYYSKKLGRLIKNSSKTSLDYGRALTVGFVSGAIVLLLDKIVENSVKNMPRLDTTSIWSLISSISSTLIILILIVSFLIWVILFLIYLGFPKENKSENLIDNPKKKTPTSEKNGSSSTKWTKINAIASIILSALAILALFLSYSAVTQTNSNEKKIIELTPSKYANIDITTSQFLYNAVPIELSKIKNKTKIGINIINTGQMNTGNLSASLDTSDSYFYADFIYPIYDIPSKSNYAFWLNITAVNYTNLIGVHKTKVRIFCPNCYEQKNVIFQEISICIWNDTAIATGGVNKITKDCGW